MHNKRPAATVRLLCGVDAFVFDRCWIKKCFTFRYLWSTPCICPWPVPDTTRRGGRCGTCVSYAVHMSNWAHGNKLSVSATNMFAATENRRGRSSDFAFRSVCVDRVESVNEKKNHVITLTTSADISMVHRVLSKLLVARGKPNESHRKPQASQSCIMFHYVESKKT